MGRVPSVGRFGRAYLLALSVLTLPSVHAGGSVVTGHLQSDALGVEKAYQVYLPEGYEGSDQRYPVIYLLHGWGVDETSWIENLGLDEAADQMGLQAIVVMPDGDRSIYVDSVTAPDYEACVEEMSEPDSSEAPDSFCVRRAAHESYIVEDLIPHVDGEFRTVPGRDARAVMGESAGGTGAMALALRNTGIFSSVASHSGSLAFLYDGPRPYVEGEVTQAEAVPADAPLIPVLGTDFENWRAHDPVSLLSELEEGVLTIYFDCGRDDPYGFHSDNLYFHERLHAHGLPHKFESVPGGHDDALWRARLPVSLAFHVASFRRSGVYPAD